MWLHSLKVVQLLRSAACLHTNQSQSYLNHLVQLAKLRKESVPTVTFILYILTKKITQRVEFLARLCFKQVLKVCGPCSLEILSRFCRDFGICPTYGVIHQKTLIFRRLFNSLFMNTEKFVVKVLSHLK